LLAIIIFALISPLSFLRRFSRHTLEAFAADYFFTLSFFADDAIFLLRFAMLSRHAFFHCSFYAAFCLLPLILRFIIYFIFDAADVFFFQMPPRRFLSCFYFADFRR